MGTKPAALMKHKQKACNFFVVVVVACLTFFLISGFVLTVYKEQPQFDKELKEYLSHLFF